MSQNKTVIQGLEPADNNSTRGYNPGGPNQNFYSRGNRNYSARGTVVPGMQSNAPAYQNVEPRQEVPRQTFVPPHPGKPVVGFLYSVSRTPFGEYWPLQLGKNTIGQSPDSNIQLSEGTVSLNHAVIITRQGKNGIIAAIKDSESTNGTFINGEAIDFEAEELHDSDIITIGQNYQLLFILIDAAKIGLVPNPRFIPIEVEQEEEDEFADVPSFGGGTTQAAGGFSPFGTQADSWGSQGGFNPGGGGTVGMDGSVSGGNHGGTVPM